MKKSSKQFALKAVDGLPPQIEHLILELYSKLKALRLTVQAGDEVPQVEASSAELIKRANDNLFGMLTMQQPEELNQTEKLNVKEFYQNYLIPGLGSITHAFEQSENLRNHLRNNHSTDLLELLHNLTKEIEQQYQITRNMQYTQIHALVSKNKQQLENILQIINDKRNK